jgi:hypothetical protein
MPWGPRTALAALVAAAITGCGSSDDKSIPPDASDQLIAQLNQVEDQVNAGQCELAQGGATVFKTKVSDLPSSVDSDTQKDLTQLADNLVELADSQCNTGASGETGAVPPPTESSTTESTETSTTTSTTSTTSTTEPEEEQPSTPPSQGPQGGESQGAQGQGNATGSGLGTNAGGSGGVGIEKPRQGGR